MITVAELIELLLACDPDLLVRVEGCDCCGDAGGIDILYGIDEIQVLITRSEEEHA